MMRRLLLLLVLAGLTITGLAGCSSLTQDNYNKLDAGMSKDDVIKLIGKPDHCESTLGFESCRWGDDGKNIDVRFAGDVLVAKSAEGL